MNDALEAAGKRSGVDVAALYKKYRRQSAEAKSVCQSDREDKLPPPLKLDKMRICKGCSGLGLRKEHYNFQVKEVNCSECDGEGLLIK
jgi:DnaJ-class molecular chaperone